VTVEDRLRATTEAVTASMRPVRPLALPPGPSGARPAAKPGRARPPRHWPGWLVPLAAAVAVISVAVTLVTVRDLSVAGPVTPTAPPASVAPLANGAPRYYVALAGTGTSKGGAPVRNAFLGDAGTGKRLATFKPPPDAVFNYVAGSSDDSTFVLEAVEGPHLGPSGSKGSSSVPLSSIWYALHLSPGAVAQAQLIRIPMLAVPINSSHTADAGGPQPGDAGVAVSPDGRTLAVLSQPYRDVGGTVKPLGPVALRTYSLTTGQPLRTWTAPLSGWSLTAWADLSWLDDGRTLAFMYPDSATHRTYVRTLDTTSPGTNLVTGSRAVFALPHGAGCGFNSLLMTPDGKAVICGGAMLERQGGGCTPGPLALNAYSVATGKLERVLYRYQGGCQDVFVQVMWAKSAALAIALVQVIKSAVPHPLITNTVVVGTPGKPASLPIIATGDIFGAPGTVAF
jgi:hypothetical protein